MCLSLSAHCRLDLSFGGGRALCITLWHQDSHGFSHLCPSGDEGREGGGCERGREGMQRKGKREGAWQEYDGIWGKSSEKQRRRKWEGRGFFFHLSRLFRAAVDELELSSFAATGGVRISSQINSPQRHHQRVIINSGFLIGFGDDTQSGEKRSSLLWIFL